MTPEAIRLLWDYIDESSKYVVAGHEGVNENIEYDEELMSKVEKECGITSPSTHQFRIRTVINLGMAIRHGIKILKVPKLLSDALERIAHDPNF